jgi:hypothetical protein
MLLHRFVEHCGSERITPSCDALALWPEVSRVPAAVERVRFERWVPGDGVAK